MIPQSLRNSIKAMNEEIRKFRNADKDVLREWSKVNAIMQRPFYVKMIGDQDWDGLINFARNELSIRHSAVTTMEQRQEQVIALNKKIRKAVTFSNAIWIPLTKGEGWETINDQLKQELSKKNITSDKADGMINDILSIDIPEVANNATEASINTIKQLDHLACKQMTAFMGASFALAIARLNKPLEVETSLTLKPEVFCKQAEKQLVSTETAIWESLRKGDLVTSRSYSCILSQQAATMLMNGSLQYVRAISKKRLSQSCDFIKDGRLAIRFGALVRSQLRAIALGHMVAWLSNWEENGPLTSNWLKSAKKLPFASKIKIPTLVPIASVAANPAKYDGEELTIEGVLSSVKIMHRGRKVISSGEISDINGTSVKITIPYIKLDSGGMIPGAFVRISGTWQKESKEINGSALLISRYNFGELSKISWSDWATLQLRSIFEQVPNGLETTYSWEAGINGAGNPLRYGVWYSK